MAFEAIKNKFDLLCKTKSCINEHLPVLFDYALECETIIECGVRRCVSSWALLYGLMHSPNKNKTLLLNDISTCVVDELIEIASVTDIQVETAWCSNLALDLTREYDLVFIDTWHVYGQLKRELNKFGPIIKKYIIMHDTTIDEINSESVRNNHDINQKMSEFNFTYEEVTIGLGRAIDEFLKSNPEWKIVKKLTNNNGLTVLMRDSTNM